MYKPSAIIQRMYSNQTRSSNISHRFAKNSCRKPLQTSQIKQISPPDFGYSHQTFNKRPKRRFQNQSKPIIRPSITFLYKKNATSTCTHSCSLATQISPPSSTTQTITSDTRTPHTEPLLDMAFVPPSVLPRARAAHAVSPVRMAARDLSAVPKPNLRTQVYGPDEDVCTFGEECELTPECVASSPALQKVLTKYLFPMREGNTQVFFDNSISDQYTIMLVFAEDRHGLVLDVVSVLKALSVRVHRTASSESESLRLILNRIEGELVSLRDLSININNCVAFWLSDEQSGDKIFDDGERLDQIAACTKVELNAPYPRPKPAFEDRWHRVTVQKNRSDRYTVFSVQTPDRPGLLAALTSAFASIDVDVASAQIQTFADRVENNFFVTKRGYKEPLKEEDIENALEAVMQALLSVGEVSDSETLWYQTRDGTAVLIAEAIFIDEVNNRELACFRFSQYETPNFRGRLPDAPYRPILLA